MNRDPRRLPPEGKGGGRTPRRGPAADAQKAGRRPGPDGMPKSNDGDQRSAAPQTPQAAAGTHDPPTHAGADTPAGRKTTTGKPTPTANATASHEPEPPPETRAKKSGDAAGRQTAGQGPEGNATSAEPGPPAAAAATTDRVRQARATSGASPADTEASETERRDAPPATSDARARAADAGDAARTNSRDAAPAATTAETTAASTPAAHPTTTERPDARTERTAGTTSGDTDDREPANATTPDTATPPGDHAPNTTTTGRTPPDRLFHHGEGPARQGRSEAEWRSHATNGSALARVGGGPATVKRQGGFSTERARLASEPARPVGRAPAIEPALAPTAEFVRSLRATVNAAHGPFRARSRALAGLLLCCRLLGSVCTAPDFVSPALPHPKGATILTVQPTGETLIYLQHLVERSRVLQGLAQDLCRQAEETRATAADLRRQSHVVIGVRIGNALTSQASSARSSRAQHVSRRLVRNLRLIDEAMDG
jgi:hypothetical protein